MSADTTFPAVVPMVRLDLDADGHLTVHVDDEPWSPPAPYSRPAGSVVPLGRSDVAWVLERLLSERDVPLRVVLHDAGRVYQDLVVPDRLKHNNPSYTAAPPGYAPDRHHQPLPEFQAREPQRRTCERFDSGGYEPGETVALAVVISRAVADEHGEVVFRLPPAVRARVGDVIAVGQDTGETWIYRPGHPEPLPTATRTFEPVTAAPSRRTLGPGLGAS